MPPVATMTCRLLGARPLEVAMHAEPLPPLTRHFVERATSRRLRRDVLDLVLAFGVATTSGAAVLYTLAERDLPPDLAGTQLAHRARDWVVVANRETGALITCYRQDDALRFVRRRGERRQAWRRAA